jgi:hypothetical protein
MRIRLSLSSFVLALCLGAMAPLATAAPRTAPTPAEVTPADAAPRRASADAVDDADAARYAARERANPKAAEFEGGNTVVIAASTTTLVLALVLIILLV